MFVIIVLQKERFDEWDALIAERAEMVMKSQLASNTCKDVFQQCLLGLPENYKECNSYSVSGDLEIAGRGRSSADSVMIPGGSRG